MVEYCTKTNKIIQIVKYPHNIKPDRHSICQYQNNIYIVDGANSQIILFNPFTKQFIVKKKLTKLGIGTSCVQFNNHIHIFNGSTNMKHIIYSIKDNTIKTLNDSITTQNINIGGVHTLHYNQRIIRFGGVNCDTDKFVDSFIMSSPIKCNNFNNIQWTENIDYKLPLVVAACGFVLYKDCIILFGGQTDGDIFLDTIYLLKLNGSNNGWIKLEHIKCPIKSQYIAVLDSNQKYVHLFTKTNKWPKCEQSVLKHYSILISKIVGNIEIENEQIDFKCEECDVLREQINVIKSEKNSLQTLVNELLNNQNKMEQQIDESKKNEIRLVQQMDILQKENINLNEECKELKIELKEIKKRFRNIDVNNYANWSSDQFIDWIISLENGKYEQYENNFRVIFKKEDVDGSVIDTIGKSEWKDWGVNNYKDRVKLDEHIKYLINKNKQNINNDNEGADNTPYI
eukprot:118683_1